MMIFVFLSGLLLLIAGAESLVRGASEIAARFNISPLIIGLTIVAFGTSSPELAVSVKAAFSNQADIAMGNVVGSNIFNVLFILGICSIISPLVISLQLIRIEAPLLVLVSLLLYYFSFDYLLGRVECGLLFLGFILYSLFLIVQVKTQKPKDLEPLPNLDSTITPQKKSPLILNVLFIVLGLIALYYGSEFLVSSAIKMARIFGVSESIIALTIVAAGTSLPEVVTSITASFRGERDIAVGNVLGSNLFNIMGVLGITGMLAPSGIAVNPQILNFDLPFMLVVAILCLPIFITGKMISRPEGIILFSLQVGYTGYLCLFS
jgi:cation:H+ antiporter